MNTITIPVVVGEDRRLTIDLPLDVPTGPADLEVIVHSKEGKIVGKAKISEREEILARMRAAGRPAIELPISDDDEDISEEELEQLGHLPPGSPTAQEIIDEEREERF